MTARPPLPRLHVITDESIARRKDLDAVARQLAAAAPGRIAFHARGRALDGRRHLELARRLPPLLFVNERLDVALAAGAAGVQLGRDALSVADARALGATWWIGRSVHDLAEARTALEQAADYLVVGPVFATATHPDRPPLGVAAFEAIVKLGRPAVAIGGITPERSAEIAAAGGWGVAAIRALWNAPDPTAAARAMMEAFA